jgi:hypothetical protein
MKRMLAAGAVKIYQVARVFRQDEIGPRSWLADDVVEPEWIGSLFLGQLLGCFGPIEI